MKVKDPQYLEGNIKLFWSFWGFKTFSLSVYGNTFFKYLSLWNALFYAETKLVNLKRLFIIYLLIKYQIQNLFQILFKSFQHSWKQLYAFGSFRRLAICLSVNSPRSIFRKYAKIVKQLIYLSWRFATACSVLKMECVEFIVRLEIISK